MTLRDAMLMLVAACVVAWGTAPFVLSSPLAGLFAVAALVLLTILLRAAAWVLSSLTDEPATLVRCAMATMVSAAVVVGIARATAALEPPHPLIMMLLFACAFAPAPVIARFLRTPIPHALAVHGICMLTCMAVVCGGVAVLSALR